jgi:radical SAM superfamily enzyme YgiQ (UPF0313 family)
MKVSLATQHADPAFTPLALLYLEANVVSHGICTADQISILEFDRAADSNAIAARVLEGGPDIAGFSCYVWNIKTLLAACREIRRRQPGILIVLGGPEVGPIAESVLAANPAVDVIVRSEGEEPFAELVRCRARGDARFDSVNGIVFRDGAQVVATPPAAILRDVNVLPSPYLTAPRPLDRRVICIETQRGCVFRCNFCFYNKDLSIRNRRFDMDRVKQEIRGWLDRDVEEIYLMDPIFNLYADRAKEICRFIAAHNHRGVGIHAEVWAEFIDDELAQLMRAANFTFLEVGLQSTDDTALATVERRLKMQRFLAGVNALQACGLNWELQLIFGLPGDTRETFRRSLNFAHRLDPPQLAVYPLLVLPGTELWRKAGELELKFDPDPPYMVRSHFSMSAGDVAYGRRVVRALHEIGGSRALRLLGRERGLSYADVLDAWIAHNDAGGAVESLSYRIKQFLVEFCDRHAIPSAFYRGFASWESAG